MVALAARILHARVDGNVVAAEGAHGGGPILALVAGVLDALVQGLAVGLEVALHLGPVGAEVALVGPAARQVAVGVIRSGLFGSDQLCHRVETLKRE